MPMLLIRCLVLIAATAAVGSSAPRRGAPVVDPVGRADAGLHVALHGSVRVVARHRPQAAVVARVRRGPFHGARGRRPPVFDYRPAGPGRGRFAQEEVVAALDAATGKTIWEHKYASPTAGANYTEGAGPHATPLTSAADSLWWVRAGSFSRSTRTPARCSGRTISSGIRSARRRSRHG